MQIASFAILWIINDMFYLLCNIAEVKVICITPIDFYSPTAQPRQQTAVVYHHTVVKVRATPSTIDCWGKTLYPTYPFFYAVTNVHFTFWFTTLYICIVYIFIMWLMKLHCSPPNQWLLIGLEVMAYELMCNCCMQYPWCWWDWSEAALNTPICNNP